MKRHSSLADLSARHTRSRGQPEPVDLLPTRRKKASTTLQRPASIIGLVSNRTSTKTPSPRTTSPPQGLLNTPPPPIQDYPLTNNMAEQELANRVAKAVKERFATLEWERNKERETVLKNQEELEELRTALQRQLDLGDTERERDANNRERQAATTLADVTRILVKMDKKDDNSIRKPSTFAHPTTTRTTAKFFTDYERYVKNRYTDSDLVRANHLPTYLTGKAFQCYDIQPTHVKDDYQQIKDKIQAYFSELEEELELEILKKFDPKIQTIDEYLEYAHHYFTARDIEDKRAILDLKSSSNWPTTKSHIYQ